MPAEETFDWDAGVKEAFGDVDKTPWIKLENDVPFVGIIKSIGGAKVDNFGGSYIEIWFHDEDIVERHLDAKKALSSKMMDLKPQPGDKVSILKFAVNAQDRDGNQLWEKDDLGQEKLDESGEKIPQSYTRYEVKVLARRGTAAPAKEVPAGKTTAAAAPRAASPAPADEINIDDIPF